jgi:hypothetical protein
VCRHCHAAQLAKSLGGHLLDRFYALLYYKLLSRELRHSARQSTLLNLVYRALLADHDEARVRAITKRLLQVRSDVCCVWHLTCSTGVVVARRAICSRCHCTRRRGQLVFVRLACACEKEFDRRLRSDVFR